MYSKDYELAQGFDILEMIKKEVSISFLSRFRFVVPVEIKLGDDSGVEDSN